jgi:MFS family permease
MEASAQGFQRYTVLWPLVPAMAMVMIDFTIVSISATTIQQDVHLSETGEQWLVTAYALATAAFVALGGRLGDLRPPQDRRDRGGPLRPQLRSGRSRCCSQGGRRAPAD